MRIIKFNIYEINASFLAYFGLIRNESQSPQLFIADFASLTSSMYLDVNTGISDDTVFKLPDDCPTTHETRGENSVLPQVYKSSRFK